ncbi:MAG: hypothetical protein ACQETO_03350 [Pseudomonadota bacterium]
MKIVSMAWILAVATWLTGSSAHAQIISLCEGMNACSSNRGVAVGIDTRVMLSWRGEAIVASPTGGRLVSDQGLFRIGDPRKGETLGSVKSPLFQTIGGRREREKEAIRFTVNETVRVPPEVSRRAADAGATELHFVRQFSMGGDATMIAFQTIPLQPSVPGRDISARIDEEPRSTGVRLERISLLFDRASVTETIDMAETLRAEASIRYQGAGLINAVWEVAMPASIQGNPFFVPIARVRDYLAGTREVTLESPVLPSREAGIYRVRLRVLEPSLDTDELLLTYRVTEQSVQQRQRVPTIDMAPPRQIRSIDENTEFRWQPVQGSDVYRLEFYDQWPDGELPDGRVDDTMTQQAGFALSPSTGLMVNGRQSSARLGRAVARRLRPGESYYWRLVAIDGEGRVLGASRLHSLAIP